MRGGIADPEGQTIASALRSLGYGGVSAVRAGKLLRIEFEAADRADAEAAVADMCRRLLANPVMEVATWELAEAGGEGEEREAAERARAGATS